MIVSKMKSISLMMFEDGYKRLKDVFDLGEVGEGKVMLDIDLNNSPSPILPLLILQDLLTVNIVVIRGMNLVQHGQCLLILQGWRNCLTIFPNMSPMSMD
jgi:hypothetical protein